MVSKKMWPKLRKCSFSRAQPGCGRVSLALNSRCLPEDGCLLTTATGKNPQGRLLSPLARPCHVGSRLELEYPAPGVCDQRAPELFSSLD
jgi:hypothetical protein